MKKDIYVGKDKWDKEHEVFCILWLLALGMGAVALLKLMLIAALP